MSHGLALDRGHRADPLPPWVPPRHAGASDRSPRRGRSPRDRTLLVGNAPRLAVRRRARARRLRPPSPRRARARGHVLLEGGASHGPRLRRVGAFRRPGTIPDRLRPSATARPTRTSEPGEIVKADGAGDDSCGCPRDATWRSSAFGRRHPPASASRTVVAPRADRSPPFARHDTGSPGRRRALVPFAREARTESRTAEGC
jgi:hypothetical protein